jgi:hypothetical protein
VATELEEEKGEKEGEKEGEEGGRGRRARHKGGLAANLDPDSPYSPDPW